MNPRALNYVSRIGVCACVAGCAFAAMGMNMGERSGGEQASAIIFIHVPTAVNSLLAALVVFVASVGYLGWRQEWWDRLASAAAIVTVLNASVLLISGSLWAKQSWGVWWQWSPRLTFSLLLWALYAAYLLIRVIIRVKGQQRAVCATYGAIAFLDVPLVYLSVNLLPDVHPQTSGFGPGTAALMWVSLAGFSALTSGLIAFLFAKRRVASPSLGKPG